MFNNFKENFMKKLLVLLVILLCSNSFQTKADNVLTSASFEVIYLESMVSGNVLDHCITNPNGPLKAKFTIKNISSDKVDLVMRAEAIKIGEYHTASICYGTACKIMSFRFPNLDPILNSLEAGLSTNTDTTDGTYIDMSTGIASVWDEELQEWIYDICDEIGGTDTLRVTIANTSDDTGEDEVSFIMIWDFKNSSIRVIEDISAKMYPNPTSNFLNFSNNNVNAQEFEVVEIFDVSGNKVINQILNDEISINVSNLERGSYVGYFTKAGKKVKTFRFVKN